MAKFKNEQPNGCIALGTHGLTIQSDKNGIIEVPDEIINSEVVDTLQSHGYFPYVKGQKVESPAEVPAEASAEAPGA